ncbi:MAG: hypothetical protein ACXW3N_03855 [Rhodoplanes sp.]
MKYALALSILLATGFSGSAIGGEKALRLAQGQVSTACIGNCNSQYQQCASVCPISGPRSQSTTPDTITAPSTGRIDQVQGNEPVQCRLNCTSQQQACFATCR